MLFIGGFEGGLRDIAFQGAGESWMSSTSVKHPLPASGVKKAKLVVLAASTISSSAANYGRLDHEHSGSSGSQRLMEMSRVD